MWQGTWGPSQEVKKDGQVGQSCWSWPLTHSRCPCAQKDVIKDVIKDDIKEVSKAKDFIKDLIEDSIEEVFKEVN